MRFSIFFFVSFVFVSCPNKNDISHGDQLYFLKQYHSLLTSTLVYEGAVLDTDSLGQKITYTFPARSLGYYTLVWRRGGIDINSCFTCIGTDHTGYITQSSYTSYRGTFSLSLLETVGHMIYENANTFEYSGTHQSHYVWLSESGVQWNLTVDDSIRTIYTNASLARKISFKKAHTLSHHPCY